MTWSGWVRSVALTAALTLTGGMAQGQRVGSDGGLVTLKSGQTLVVGPRATLLRADARMPAAAAVQFRRLPLEVVTEVAVVAGEMPGNTITGTTPSQPFTLTLRAPFAAGRGFLNGADVSINGSSNTAQIDGEGWIGVWSLGSSTEKRYTVHFQLSEITNSTTNYIVKFADGSTFQVPAKPNQMQDILVLVTLPNDTPITSPHLLASITRAGPARANLLGVEVTPM